jgi:hypothetical protein
LARLTRLLHAAVRELRSNGAQVVTALGSHPHVRIALRAIGFIERPGPALTNMSSFPDDGGVLRWHLTALDSDYAWRF